MTLRLAIIFAMATSVLLFMTLINKVHEILIQGKWTTRVRVFLAFLANVGSRELPGLLPLGSPSVLCPGTTGGLKAPDRPSAAGNNDCWSLHIPHVIYKQQTRGKHTDFDGKTRGKMGGNHQNTGKTQGK